MKDIVERFSTHLKNVLTRALCFVVENNQAIILPEHLLWALGTEKGSLGAELLHKMKVAPERLRVLVAAQVSSSSPSSPVSSSGNPHLSDNAKRAIEKAVLSANVYEHRYVGTEHLLSGLLQVQDGTINAFFTEEKTDLKELKHQISHALKSASKFPDLTDAIQDDRAVVAKEEEGAVTTEEAEETTRTPALDYFGRDLTLKETQETIDPVVGRENEIERVMEILCRRTKNNPLLLGEPGVGKTAIVEGLAKRILEGHVPPALAGRRIVSLDLALLIAGTMYRGEFEGRLRQIVEEIKKQPNIILFIDEIHTIVGAGAASGSLDAANILKPALARGEIRCIGATTHAEFKKHMETDSALERRFQTVTVEEPTAEKALEILRGVAPHYERYHGVTISDEALESAVRLSVRYLSDKRLPDKALDLIDESAASIRVHAAELGPVEERRRVEQQLKGLRESKRQAVVEERFEDALALKNEEEALRPRLSSLELRAKPTHTITSREVAGVIARMCRLPVAEVLREEQRSLDTLQPFFEERIFGQREAVEKITQTIRRAKVGLSDPRRPLASFLLLGPSGVGKTECAKIIAEAVFHDPKALIRLDMSEYAEAFTASKLVGAPAGYIGYREPSKLTDRVKQRSSCVVLFDELEKAHPDVQNLLLQLLEEGELTDATGRSVHFKNAIVVMTSNVGLEKFQTGSMGFAAGESARTVALTEDVRRELQERFRPELLNRIDQTIVFQPLSATALEQIAEHHVKEAARRLSARGVRLTWPKTLAAHFSASARRAGGAREIRRLVETHIENAVAEHLTHGTPETGFRVQLRDGNVSVHPLAH